MSDRQWSLSSTRSLEISPVKILCVANASYLVPSGGALEHRAELGPELIDLLNRESARIRLREPVKDHYRNVRELRLTFCRHPRERGSISTSARKRTNPALVVRNQV